jgi:predicted CXXCH cytochrome family protein
VPSAEPAPASSSKTAGYVDNEICADCHSAQYDKWLGSHHYHAMALATQATVQGDFDDARFTHLGKTTRFFTKDGRFYVAAEGPDGAPGEFEVLYTFGYQPLQQYLLDMPGGRFQALDIAWDTAQGRWFHLLPDEPIEPDDPLHWTGPFYTWNASCAFCHSTGLNKGYDPVRDTFTTSWAEINVGCQACHGPGEAHVAWAGPGAASDQPTGLVTTLGDQDAGAEIEVCAACHSRRRALSHDYRPGDAFMDHFLPAVLRDELYFPDGQILDEVYVYGSFVQSRMYRAGVACSDCHDPHSGELRAEGNAVCIACHSEDPPPEFSSIRPLAYDSPAHHFHQPGSAGAQCVNCHMPARTYMVVDPRRDHSFRIPRPDLSIALGTPNACTQCHGDRSDEWASDQIASWYGPDRRTEPHFGAAIAAGRRGEPGARDKLISLALDDDQPAIARATALSLLGGDFNAAVYAAVRRSLADRSPMVRLHALQASGGLPPEDRLRLAAGLLEDPVRGVRIEAARVLAEVPARAMSAQHRAAFLGAGRELLLAEASAAERPEAYFNIGVFYAAAGNPTEAEMAYRQAIEIDGGFVPAYVNLAELYRGRGETVEERRLLVDAIQVAPDNAVAHFALGLLEVRQRRYEAALKSFERAVELDPETARYSYVYAVALESVDRRDDAIDVLEETAQRHPWDRDVLVALVDYLMAAEDHERARDYVEKLLAVDPGNPAALRLHERLSPTP